MKRPNPNALAGASAEAAFSVCAVRQPTCLYRAFVALARKAYCPAYGKASSVCLKKHILRWAGRPGTPNAAQAVWYQAKASARPMRQWGLNAQESGKRLNTEHTTT